MMTDASDRREYYRIDDVVGLSYKILPEDSAEEGTDNESAASLAHDQALSKVETEVNLLINTLWTENPTTAKALGLLNRKIDLLVSQLSGVHEGQDALLSYANIPVSLSGSGIAFGCNERIEPGHSLELKILLKPSYVAVRLRAKVVGCDASGDKTDSPYWLRASFVGDDLSQQEQIIRHIVQRHTNNSQG